MKKKNCVKKNKRLKRERKKKEEIKPNVNNHKKCEQTMFKLKDKDCHTEL